LRCVVLAPLLAMPWRVCAEPHLRFEVATLSETPEFSVDHFTDAMFRRLNLSSPRGPYFIGAGSDEQRAQIEGAGNTLVAYYDALVSLYKNSGRNGSTAADAIDFYVRELFIDNGPAPKWLVLNEISAALWPGDAGYRNWLVATVTRLHRHYGYELIVLSPFPNPGANDASWKRLSADSHIGAQHYLSGDVIKANGFAVAWAQGKYESTKKSYRNRGVPAERIFIVEHFAQTVAGTGWGRAGVSADEWERAIRVRDEAILNTNFAGFVSYAWGKNGMRVSDKELIRFEDAHLSMPVLQSEIEAARAEGTVGWERRLQFTRVALPAGR
jgi:hypothetical protein